MEFLDRVQEVNDKVTKEDHDFLKMITIEALEKQGFIIDDVIEEKVGKWIKSDVTVKASWNNIHYLFYVKKALTTQSMYLYDHIRVELAYISYRSREIEVNENYTLNPDSIVKLKGLQLSFDNIKEKLKTKNDRKYEKLESMFKEDLGEDIKVNKELKSYKKELSISSSNFRIYTRLATPLLIKIKAEEIVEFAIPHWKRSIDDIREDWKKVFQFGQQYVNKELDNPKYDIHKMINTIHKIKDKYKLPNLTFDSQHYLKTLEEGIPEYSFEMVFVNNKARKKDIEYHTKNFKVYIVFDERDEFIVLKYHYLGEVFEEQIEAKELKKHLLTTIKKVNNIN